MKRVMGYAALGLVLCALLPATAGDKGLQVTRPYYYWDHSTFRINLITGESESSGFGVASHVGRLTSEGAGHVLDLSTMQFEATGTTTGASGDQTFWEGRGFLSGDFVITIVGGTGRFEGASGELPTWEVENMESSVEGDYLIITADLTGTGWISY